ncbi:MAG: porin [Desulfuromonadaceae bacterium]|nr:porin [Desulfuromonadaceae bacterium]
MIVLPGLGLLTSLATVAAAASLEEVLKEKHVITEAEYTEIMKGRPTTYKPGEGFKFTSADGKFNGSVGGSLQIRYTLMDLDDVNDSSTKHAQDSSKFELKRIKLLLNGSVYYPELSYKMSVNFANIAGGTISNSGLLEETWLNYRLRDEVQFRIGQDKVQFGRQHVTPSSSLQFVDQSIVTSAFVPGYDTGISINGKVAGGIINYSIAGLGGVGQNTYRTTTDNAFAARITTNPLGDMKYSEPDLDASEKPLASVGADFYRNTIYSGETNNLGFTKSSGWYGIGSPLMTQKFSTGEALDFNTFGVDTAFKWQGLSVTAEYFAGEAKGQASKRTLRAEGVYAQAGYFIVPKHVELAYRYSYFDPNRNISADHWLENTVAASWYLNNHNVKLQADYTAIHKQPAIASTSGKSATDDQQIRVQAQLVF